MLRRSSGSPPVSRIFSTPRPAKMRASRAISSNVSSSCVRQELVVRAEDLLRHAVDAAEVAAVGDRDAQVAQRPAAACRRPAGAACAQRVAQRDDAVERCGCAVGERNDPWPWSRCNGIAVAIYNVSRACSAGV